MSQIEKLCSELGIVDEKQLAVLKTWCQDKVSKDIHFNGPDSVQFGKYYKLASDYLDFLSHSKQDLIEPVAEFVGESTLQHAAKCGYHHFIEQLQPTQEALDKLNQNHMTPLHMSASFGYPNTVEVLLAKGANPRIKNGQGQYPIFGSLFLPVIYQAEKPAQKIKIFEMLAKKAPDTLDAQDQDGETLMHKIAQHAEFVDLFSELDPKLVGVANDAGRYPIHTSILNGQVAVIKHLLSMDGVVDQLDGKKHTPLHYAARYGNENTVKFCIESGAKVNEVDSENQTPLIMAAVADKSEVVKYLLAHGASSHIVDANGKSAIDYAKESQNPNMRDCIHSSKSLGAS